MTTSEVAELLAIPQCTLEAWRRRQTRRRSLGPRWRTIGSHVYYDPEPLRQWIDHGEAPCPEVKVATRMQWAKRPLAELLAAVAHSETYSEAQLAAALGVPAGTLRQWRYLTDVTCRQHGPAFRRHGGSITYQRDTIVAWLTAGR